MTPTDAPGRALLYGKHSRTARIYSLRYRPFFFFVSPITQSADDFGCREWPSVEDVETPGFVSVLGCAIRVRGSLDSRTFVSQVHDEYVRQLYEDVTLPPTESDAPSSPSGDPLSSWLSIARNDLSRQTPVDSSLPSSLESGTSVTGTEGDAQPNAGLMHSLFSQPGSCRDMHQIYCFGDIGVVCCDTFLSPFDGNSSQLDAVSEAFSAPVLSRCRCVVVVFPLLLGETSSSFSSAEEQLAGGGGGRAFRTILQYHQDLLKGIIRAADAWVEQNPVRRQVWYVDGRSVLHTNIFAALLLDGGRGRRSKQSGIVPISNWVFRPLSRCPMNVDGGSAAVTALDGRTPTSGMKHQCRNDWRKQS